MRPRLLQPWTVLLLAAACTAPQHRPAAVRGPAPAPYIVVPASEPREQTADQQVQQVLNRLAFGARPGDAARVRAMGVDQWIALQPARDGTSAPATDAVLATYEGLRLPTADLVAAYAQGQQAIRQLQRRAGQRGDTT